MRRLSPPPAAILHGLRKNCFAVIRESAEQEATEEAENPRNYRGGFLPPLPRWDHLNFKVHSNIGDALNKALGSREEANPTTLHGVLQHIEFCQKVGRSPLDVKLRKLIYHFRLCLKT